MRFRSLVFGALCAGTALLSPGAASAAEAPSHPLLFEVKEFPQPTGKDFLAGPCGIAVDSNGKLYVSDYYNDRVVTFRGSDGFYQSSFKEVEPVDGPCGLAVDPVGDLFVNAYHRSVLSFPAPWSTATATLMDAGNAPTTTPAIRPTGVARDPSTGRVYVDDRTYIAAYEPSGAPVEVGGQPLRIGEDENADYYGLAVSGYPGTAGFLYVADAATDTVKVFDPANPNPSAVAEITGEGSPLGGFDYLVDAALAVDDTTGHLFVVDNFQGPFFEHPEAALYEFNSEGDYRGRILNHELTAGEPSGIAVASPGAPTAGDLYVTSGNSERAKLFGLGPTGPAKTLQVALAGVGEGTVTSQPAGIRCGGACSAEFNEGASVSLTATPQAGSAFTGWSVTGSAPCPGTGTCTVSLVANVEVAAEFGPAPAGAGTAGLSPVADARDSQAASGPTADSGQSGSAAGGGPAIAAPVITSSRRHQRTHHRRHTRWKPRKRR
jgi:hypothetical protein